ncbi:MAG: helix-turn-helix domain-containing protein [Sphingorhabdus sp.]
MADLANYTAPACFIASMRGEQHFEHKLLDRDGIQLVHHANEAGSYKLDGLASHAVAVQLSKAGRHTATLAGHNHRGSAGRGMSWLKPAGMPLAWQWDDPAEMINIWISPEAWQKTVTAALATDAKPTGFIERFVSDDPLVAQIAFALKTEAELGHAYGRLLTDSLIIALIAHLANRSLEPRSAPLASGGLSSWHTRRVLEYIDSRLTDDIPLAELAALTQLSERHFCTAFGRSVGMPPHRYLIERRIDRAKTLLRDNVLSITHVALSAGFNSSAHFATMFRRSTGLSPTRWRATL